MKQPQLNIRVRHTITPHETTVEVYDPETGETVGYLDGRVGEISWTKTPTNPLSILTLEVACERGSIDGLEI